MDNKYLNEERYQKNKKKISKVALIVLLIGILLGGGLIALGLFKKNHLNSPQTTSKINDQLAEEVLNLEKKINELETNVNSLKESEKIKLETLKDQLKNEGVVYSTFAKYDEGKKYDLRIITEVLDPSMNYCAFSEYKNNELTKDYCKYVNGIDDDSMTIKTIRGAINSSMTCSDYNNNLITEKYCGLLEDARKIKSNQHNGSYVPLFMIGGFIIISSCMISGSIFMFTKQREILAFQAQQVMPVAKEGIETLAPSIGKAGASIMKEMSPIYGDVAKEITKGIKEGLKDKETKEE